VAVGDVLGGFQVAHIALGDLVEAEAVAVDAGVDHVAHGVVGVGGGGGLAVGAHGGGDGGAVFRVDLRAAVAAVAVALEQRVAVGVVAPLLAGRAGDYAVGRVVAVAGEGAVAVFQDAVTVAVVLHVVDGVGGGALVVHRAHHAAGGVVGVLARHAVADHLHAVAGGIEAVADVQLLTQLRAAAGVVAGVGRHAGEPAQVVVRLGLLALRSVALAAREALERIGL
jgi:hypothetical protein